MPEKPAEQGNRRHFVAHVHTPAGAIPMKLPVPDPVEYHEPRPRDVLTNYLKGTLQVAEEYLEKLGKPRDTWRTLEVRWGGGTPRPIFAYGMDAREALGKSYRLAERATRKPAELPAWRAIRRAARRIQQSEGGNMRQAIARAFERDPNLYQRYEAERFKILPKLAQMEAWRHAEVAALMASALQHLHSPLTMFAAGIVEGEYHQYNHQQERWRKELARRDRLAEAAARRARQKAGQKKTGKRMPQTVLTRETVELLTDAARPSSWTEVLAVLTGKHPEADELLERLKDVVNPIELQDGNPPIDVEGDDVFFHFKNRPDRKMTLARFKNAVSEAVYTVS